LILAAGATTSGALLLATCKRLSQEACSEFRKSLDASVWADIIVADLRETKPASWRQRATRMREVSGLYRELYSAVPFTQEQLAEAIARAE
jgi:hypothetical protein